jgi:hypothetical protein
MVGSMRGTAGTSERQGQQGEGVKHGADVNGVRDTRKGREKLAHVVRASLERR